MAIWEEECIWYECGTRLRGVEGGIGRIGRVFGQGEAIGFDYTME